jgi:threonine synthase
VNLVPPLADLRGRDLASFPGGPWGWPTAAGTPSPMGEGNTPLIRLEDGLWVKDESRNPTGSHKDRAMTVGVAAAREHGARTVVAASSGNAGASAAAYAARAGLRCVVLTTVHIPAVLAGQTRAFGAPVIPFPDTAVRDRMMESAVTGLGWYPLTNYVQPAAGGNPYGNEGYKSIAYELARDLGSDVDTVVVPTSRADLLAGIERGYRELAGAGLVTAVPRMIAAETSTAAAFSAALEHGDRAAQERTTVSGVLHRQHAADLAGAGGTVEYRRRGHRPRRRGLPGRAPPAADHQRPVPRGVLRARRRGRPPGAQGRRPQRGRARHRQRAQRPR